MENCWESCLCEKIIFRYARLNGIDFEPSDSLQFSGSLLFGMKSSRKRICNSYKSTLTCRIKSCGMLLLIWDIRTFVDGNVSLLSNQTVYIQRFCFFTDMSR